MKRELAFLLLITHNFVVSVRRSSSSSGCLGKAELFYCGTPWAFHINILTISLLLFCFGVAISDLVQDLETMFHLR